MRHHAHAQAQHAEVGPVAAGQRVALRAAALQARELRVAEVPAPRPLAEVAAEGAAGAHAHVGDFGFHLGEHGQALLHQVGSLDRPVCRSAADKQSAALGFDLVQVRNRLHIDQVLVTQQIMFHRQQELGAAGVKPALVAELGEHLRSLGDRFWFVNDESS